MFGGHGFCARGGLPGLCWGYFDLCWCWMFGLFGFRLGLVADGCGLGV